MLTTVSLYKDQQLFNRIMFDGVCRRFKKTAKQKITNIFSKFCTVFAVTSTFYTVSKSRFLCLFLNWK